MLNFLVSRENGSHDNKSLTRAECTRRLYLLDVSRMVDVEKTHKAGVNTLDLDLIENR